MNRKGGCGKTTVAVNLAACYSVRGYATAIYDTDPQHAARHWCDNRRQWYEGRPTSRTPAVDGVPGDRQGTAGVTYSWRSRLPPGTERVVVDTPAGLDRAALDQHLREIDAVLIPVLPSSIDAHATADFIRDLLLKGRALDKEIRVGIVANRVRQNTLAFQRLERFLERLQIPMVTQLRDTQRYVQAASEGLGITELRNPAPDMRDDDAWSGLMNWLEARRANVTTGYWLGPHAHSDVSLYR